jgi:pimeloyl-ACP methyl ester carboxylesterase
VPDNARSRIAAAREAATAKRWHEALPLFDAAIAAAAAPPATWLAGRAGSRWGGGGASPDRKLRQDAVEIALWQAETLPRAGDAAPAQALLALVEAQAPSPRIATKIETLRDIARSLRHLGPPAPADSTPDFDAAAVIPWRHPEGEDRAILVFAGGGAKLWMTLEGLHRKLSAFRCHLVYVRDPDVSFFLERRATGENADAIAQGLRAAVQGLGATRIFCLGNSMGGYAALRYGLDLGAEAVLAFAPVTDPAAQSLDPEIVPRLRRRQPGLMLDLVSLYRDAARRPRATLCYGGAHHTDRAAARRLLGIPGIRCLAAEGVGVHSVIRWFLAHGGFDQLVAAMLDDRAAPTIPGTVTEDAA